MRTPTKPIAVLLVLVLAVVTVTHDPKVVSVAYLSVVTATLLVTLSIGIVFAVFAPTVKELSKSMKPRSLKRERHPD